MEILKWIVAATSMCDLHVYGSVASVIIHTSSSSPFSSLLPPCSLCFLLLFPLPSQPPTSPYLLNAAMSLLRLLWQGRHDAALVALRSQPDFWKHLTSPLFNELQLSEVEETNIEVYILPYHFCFLWAPFHNKVIWNVKGFTWLPKKGPFPILQSTNHFIHNRHNYVV